MDLDHVFWIGGATGAGKSSIARALAARHDLQLYNVDHRTWAHVRRSPPDPLLSLSQDERWLAPRPEELVERFVAAAAARLPLIVEDLERLPSSPGAIAEGPFLLPSLIAPFVASPSHALFLVPGERRQREVLAARGSMALTSDPERARENLTRRNVLLAELVSDQAAASGLPVLRVEGSLEEMIDLADEHLSDALSSLPRIVDRPAVRRLENDVLAEQVRLYLASPDAPPEGSAPLPFACECETPGCADLVELTLDEYDTISSSGDRSRLRRPRS